MCTWCSLRRYISLLLISITLASCSPGYVIRGAYEQGKLLWEREEIEEVIADSATAPDIKHKLEVVRDARLFTQKLSLQPGDSYTTYTKLDRDTLAWITMGAKKDSFTLKTWWFPIVGEVPYKGYFEKEDAEEAAADLEKEGYETNVRGTEAFSTLGWFNDPVLTPSLKHPDHQVANTVIHETLHRTIWIPGSVEFNESLANFVGTEGAVDFIRSRNEDVTEVEIARDSAYRLSAVIEKLYNELDTLYKSSLPTAEKLTKRVEIFESHLKPIRERNPGLKIFAKINNAEIMQYRIYVKDLETFKALLTKTDRDWGKFIEEIQEIKKAVDDNDSLDPFKLLREHAGI